MFFPLTEVLSSHCVKYDKFIFSDAGVIITAWDRIMSHILGTLCVWFLVLLKVPICCGGRKCYYQFRSINRCSSIFTLIDIEQRSHVSVRDLTALFVWFRSHFPPTMQNTRRFIWVLEWLLPPTLPPFRRCFPDTLVERKQFISGVCLC
jgi:hypothetical protein